VWPKIIKERDFEGFVEEPEPATDPVVDDIVIVAESIGLQVDSGDVEELVEEHSEELSTEELQQLLAEQQRMAAEELSEEEREDQQSVQQISSSEIKEILNKWTELHINLMFVVPYILVTYVLFKSNWMYNILFPCKVFSSTCFGCYFHPSSAAQL
jgi:hypothetical protein